jgi:hypothetical protein
MGRAFTAAPLFLLGLLAAALGAATANVSGGGGGRQEPIEKKKTLFYSIRGCLCGD